MRTGMTRPTPGEPAPAEPTPTALLAVVGTLDEASAAARAGADLVQLTAQGTAITADSATVTAFLARHPGVRFSVAAGSGTPAAAPAAGAPTDVTMIFADTRSAAASGLPRDRVLIDVPLDRPLPAGWPEPEGSPPDRTLAAAGGWPVLIDLDRAAALAAGAAGEDDPAEIVALAALSCWLGAAAVRTRQVTAVRRALDMANSIRGLRPPTYAVRGLA
jgi:dihydropteroate synthase